MGPLAVLVSSASHKAIPSNGDRNRGAHAGDGEQHGAYNLTITTHAALGLARHAARQYQDHLHLDLRIRCVLDRPKVAADTSRRRPEPARRFEPPPQITDAGANRTRRQGLAFQIALVLPGSTMRRRTDASAPRVADRRTAWHTGNGRSLWRTLALIASRCRCGSFRTVPASRSENTHRYGRALRGARVHDHAPCARWQTSTFLAALRVTGLTAPGVFDGAIDGASFLAYIEQILVPTLHSRIEPPPQMATDAAVQPTGPGGRA